jgi:outer membrane receptor protein involved in Fe transport
LLLVGPVKASSFQTGDRQLTLNGYGRVDFRAGWTPCDDLELFFEIQNLTDRTYREAVGFEAPGIAPRVGLVWRI